MQSLKEYFTALQWLALLVASVGVIMPGFAYLFDLAPPLVRPIAFITAGAAAAVMLATFFYRPRSHEVRRKIGLPFLVRRAVWALCLSLLLLLIYSSTLQLWTVDPGPGTRLQIGFGTWDRGLTELGQAAKRLSGNGAPIDLLLEGAIVSDDGIRQLWEWWGVYGAGLLLALLFLASATLWTLSWCLFARQLALTKVELPKLEKPPIKKAR